MSYFQSRRSAVMAPNGAVATSQPLAAQAGLDVLRRGGTAADAAVCAAAVLSVVEPMSTGLGGDLFALYWDQSERRVTSLNASGVAPRAASAEQMRAAGHQSMPIDGLDVAKSITVPGTVDGWVQLLARFGRCELGALLAPAIDYAENGFLVSELIAWHWQQLAPKLAAHPSGAELLHQGRAPQWGEKVRLPSLASSLRKLAVGGREAFYTGELAERIARYAQSNAGWLTVEDLAAHQSQWTQPLCRDYQGVSVWEHPPSGQGLAALLALNITDQLGAHFRSLGPQSPERYHVQTEAMRMAFADARAFIADPDRCEVPTEALLSGAHARRRAAQFELGRALGEPIATQPPVGDDTVYVAAVDQWGNACSLINSTYHGFGSGLVVPETGIALQNRGAGFSLQPGHPCELQAGHRPYHTIIPGMLTRFNGREQELMGPFGVMAGWQQPQGHLQLVSNLADFGMGPQEALDALRFCIDVPTGLLRLEQGVDPQVLARLQEWGHSVRVDDGFMRQDFGGAQLILRHGEGWACASEPRKDGLAAAY